MSYCRFTEGDVYAYETDGGVQFWVSSDNKALDRLCNTFNEAYRYAKELRDVHGLDVPSYAIEALKEDALEEAKRISGASGVIGELQAENDKLELENAKLRDAMYTNAGKHALQHMDEDELRIWATQQAEYIEELRELARDLRFCARQSICLKCVHGRFCDLRFDERCKELGIEAD